MIMSIVYQRFLEKHGGYTDIQKKAIPLIAGGDNCIVIAPTGAGKTEAALLPLLDRILKEEDRLGVKALYITPLRALNRDMIGRVEKMCSELGVTVSVRHGDTTQSERARQARSAPMLLITTPETLQSILPTKTIGAALRKVKVVVIDEIHELYHNKRGAQLSLALERLEELSPGFQRIGISATVGDPEMISKFLCGNRNCEVASIDYKKRMSIQVELPHRHSKKLNDFMEKFGLDGNAAARLETIAGHVMASNSTLIFANTRQIVESLGNRLINLNKVEPFGGIGVHHSSLDRKERVDMEDSFKAHRIKSIIATSSLELGIDIGHVDLVVHYGSPRQALRAIQRIGRSGHTEKGTSRGAIVSASMIDAIESIAISRNVDEGALERFSIHENALDVLANQICGIALDKGTSTMSEVYGIITRAFAYSKLDGKALKELLYFMERQRMIGFDGNVVSSGPRTRMYYYSHLSVIPDTQRFMVRDMSTNRIISSLDEKFVASSVDENSIFITKGLPWKVISIDENTITVEPSSDLDAAIPDWSGEDIPVSRGVTEGVFELLNDRSLVDSSGSASIALKGEIKDFIERQGAVGIPNRSELFIEQAEGYKILYTGLGTLANEALSRLIAHAVVKFTGRSINTKSSPYLIFLEMPRETDLDGIIDRMSREDPARTLEETVQDTELFRYRFITVAKLFGIVEKDATVTRSVAKRIMKVLSGTPVYSETVRELMHNYFDIEALRALFHELSTGKRRIRTVEVVSLSPLSKEILASAYYTKELIMPILPNRELVESFSKFMLAKSIKLICTYCGMFFSRKLDEIKSDDKIRCPNCSSPLIAPHDDSYVEVLEKRKNGKRLSGSERDLLAEIMRQASLIDSYGGRAAIALSTYGVGPTSAARILMMFRKEDRLFYTDLIEAQKQFIKNKKYWAIR